MYRRFLGAVVVLSMVFISGSVRPESVTDGGDEEDCDTRNEMIDYLKRDFQEEPHALGFINEKSVIEIFVSPRSYTWTILVTSADGTSCILTDGEKMEIFGSGLGSDT